MTSISSTSKPSIVVTQLAQIALNNDGVNLSKDHSDFPCPPELIGSLVRFVSEGKNKYAPSEGIFELREVIADFYSKNYGQNYNPESEITITAGAIQAIYTAISSLIREGDEVIVFEPAFETYVPAIEAKGAKPVFFQLNPVDFSIDWSVLPKLINSNTKLIIINTPHNPTGKVFTDEDFEQLQKILNGTKISIICDEASANLVYDDNTKTSISRFPKLVSRTIIVGSLGKTLYVPGWKIGYTLAPSSLMHNFREVHRYQIYSVNLPIQLALAEYLKGKVNWSPYIDDFRHRRSLFASLMLKTRFTLYPVDGGYFQVIGYENISQERDTEFCLRVAQEIGVTMYPLSLFYHDSTDNQKLRVCFGKSEEELQSAVNLLSSL